MNRKPLINKDIIKKGLIAGTAGDEGYRADAAGDREPQGCKVPGKRRSLCKVGLLITN
jgi:hypothetical protein